MKPNEVIQKVENIEYIVYSVWTWVKIKKLYLDNKMATINPIDLHK